MDEESAPAFLSRKRREQQRGNPKIKKNTRAQLTLKALNLKGRGANSVYNEDSKWRWVHENMRDRRIGVLVAGETHLTSEQVDEIESSDYGRRLKIFNSIDPDKPNTKGVAVVLNKDLTNIEGVDVRRLIPGRAILVTIPWHGTRTHTVLAVYAPADSMEENKAFWDELYRMWIEIDLPVPDSLMGDTNIVEEMWDRLPHRADAEAATQALGQLKALLGLKDGWRAVNPDTKDYTYMSPSSGSMSRLDRIYVPDDVLKTCRDWKIEDVGEISDHRMVSVTITAPGAPFIGKGRYAIPLFILKDKEFMDFALAEGIKLENSLSNGRTDEENIQTCHKKFKDAVLEMAQKRAKESQGALEQNKQKLERKKTALMNSPTTETAEGKKVATEAARLQGEINSIITRQAARKRTDVKIRCRTELDHITKFSVNLSKDKSPRDTFYALRRTDVVPEISCKRSDEMAELARNYHNDLQHDESEQDSDRKDTEIAEVLDHVDNQENAPGMQELAEDLTETDVLESLLGSAKGKAPGIDGIPAEFWIKLYQIYKETEAENKKTGESKPAFNVIKVLTILYNDIKHHDVARGTEFATGWMCPFFKKKDVTDIANYRPITLLNTDYKTYTKALATKL
ncbi:Endonuclease/exonuclease/phosphatase, partial [Mycena polygramma]